MEVSGVDLALVPERAACGDRVLEVGERDIGLGDERLERGERRGGAVLEHMIGQAARQQGIAAGEQPVGRGVFRQRGSRGEAATAQQQCVLAAGGS